MKWINFVIWGASLTILISAQSEAEIYKWVDENGKVHFTDSRTNIPIRSKVETRSELISTTTNKEKSNPLGITNHIPTLSGESLQGEKRIEKHGSSKVNSRQKEILEKMEKDIIEFRKKLKEYEAQYKTIKQKSIETSQEAFNDIDYSDQHREDRHSLQRKAYWLGEELAVAKSNYFDMKEKLKYKEYQLEEFRRSLE